MYYFLYLILHYSLPYLLASATIFLYSFFPTFYHFYTFYIFSSLTLSYSLWPWDYFLVVFISWSSCIQLHIVSFICYAISICRFLSFIYICSSYTLLIVFFVYIICLSHIILTLRVNSVAALDKCENVMMWIGWNLIQPLVVMNTGYEYWCDEYWIKIQYFFNIVIVDYIVRY